MKMTTYVNDKKVSEEAITPADFMHYILKAHDLDICTLASEEGTTVDIFFSFVRNTTRLHFEEEK